MLTPAWFELGLLVTAGAAALDDLAERRIPNALLAAGFCCAALLHLAQGSPATLAGGCTAGLLLMLPMYLLHGTAAGDVKLMMVLGAFGGPLFAFYAVLAGFLVFGAAAMLALRAGLCVRSQQWPLAPSLALGSLFALAQISR